MSHAGCQATPLAESPDLGRLPLIAAAATTLVSWAGAFVAIGIAARELSPAPFALARLGLAAIVLLLCLPLLRGDALRLPRWRDMPGLALMALLAFPVYHTALNAGQQVVSPGVASLLINTLPIFAAIIARFMLAEKLSLIGWAGIAIAFAGVAILVAGNGTGFEINVHALLILVSALSGAFFMVIQRHFTRRYSGFALTLWGLWLGSLMLTPFAPQLVAELSSASADTWYAVAYLGVFPTALAFVTWAYVLKRLPAARATSLMYFVPPMTFAFAWLVIGEVPSVSSIVGALVILSGIALVQRNRQRTLRTKIHRTAAAVKQEPGA